MKTVYLTPMRFEVSRFIQGRPSYHWVQGYLIRNPDTSWLAAEVIPRYLAPSFGRRIMDGLMRRGLVVEVQEHGDTKYKLASKGNLVCPVPNL